MISTVSDLECYVQFFHWLRDNKVAVFALTEDQAEDYITDMPPMLR